MSAKGTELATRLIVISERELSRLAQKDAEERGGVLYDAPTYGEVIKFAQATADSMDEGAWIGLAYAANYIPAHGRRATISQPTIESAKATLRALTPNHGPVFEGLPET